MNRESKTKTELNLDQTRLFGFRNLVPVAGSEANLQKSAAAAFNKIGAPEGPSAPPPPPPTITGSGR